MMRDTFPRGGSPDRCGLRTNAGRLAVLPGLLLLAACSGGAGGLWNSTAAPGPSPAAVAASQDPIAVFAAQATPGAQSRVTLADGQPANLRLGRSYFAASGRECREVLVGAGVTQRNQLVCQAEGGVWVPARPLLRGGAARS